MAARQFYKTVITYEVLSEETIPGHVDLEYIAKEAQEGRYVGRFLRTEEIPLSGAGMAVALTAAGSDPGFFMLDDAGNDFDESDPLPPTCDGGDYDENDPEPERNEWEKDD